MALAQLGAEVVRFDPIGGGIDYGRWPLTAEGRSLYWAGLNKGKKSLAVNLRDPAAHELLTELIGSAGTFLTNFPARGWMAPDRLTARRADLVMVAITGNRDGTTAVDYTVNAAMGFPMVTGAADIDGPVNSVLPAWDLLCGQTAAVGILAAERRRLLTGEGSVMMLALSDVALAATAALGYIAEVQVNGALRPRCGNDLYGAFGVELSTSDERRLYAVGISGRQWASLLEATESEAAVAEISAARGLDFNDEGDRFEARHEIKAVMQDWAGQRPLAEAAERFDALGVCWGPYQTFAELVENDPRCSVAAGLFREMDQPGIGPYLVPGSPLAFGTGPGLQSGAFSDAATAPALGQHTNEVLAGWLGLSDGEIGRLHDSGVVAAGS
jgi:2-methylfumaryl-CoA isomerase